MNCQIKETLLRYDLTRDYRVEFTAYAPMHTFTGWTLEGVEGAIEIDPDTRAIQSAWATAKTRFFNTGDPERTRAMAKYMQPETYPLARIDMTQCKKVDQLAPDRFKASMLAVLEFMGVRRQLPLSVTTAVNGQGLTVDLSLKWSFSAYGLTAPSLLFLTVRDIVDIRGRGEFLLAEE